MLETDLGNHETLSSLWLTAVEELLDAPEVKNTRELLFTRAVLTQPFNRWIQIEERKPSTFCSAMEIIWVLAGNNEIKYLQQFLPRVAEWSDDGERWRAGYGKRILRFGDSETNQLDYCLNELARDPLSRRAVVSLWSPSEDSQGQPSKDFPCLAGETEIWSPEGNIQIKDLAEKFESGEISKFPVLGFDEDSRQVKFTYLNKVWKSGTKKTIKLTFDDGSVLRVTPDHRLYRKRKTGDGRRIPVEIHCELVEAGTLEVGNSVWATHFRDNAAGRPYFIRNLSENWHHANQAKVHREYYKFLNGDIPDGIDIHHKDDNRYNNREENLEALDHSFHSSLKMFGDKNPMRWHTEGIKKRAESLQSTLKEQWKGKTRKDWEDRFQPNNHKIVSIEPDEETDVYDFTVPETHNAVLSSGVVVHNCSNHLQFLLRDGQLHTCLKMRSNDAVWGMCHINIPEFTVIQELMALFLSYRLQTKIVVGEYIHEVGSLHFYTDGRLPFDLRSIVEDSDEDFFLTSDRRHQELKLHDSIRSFGRLEFGLKELLWIFDPTIKSSLVDPVEWARMISFFPDVIKDLLWATYLARRYFTIDPDQNPRISPFMENIKDPLFKSSLRMSILPKVQR